MGNKGRDIFSTLTTAADEKYKIEVYLNKFSKYFNPQCNTVFSRYLFHKPVFDTPLPNKRDQRDGQPVLPQDLNKAIKRPHHPIPTFDKAILKHSAAKFFAMLDVHLGYWTHILDEDLPQLTIFNI